MSQSLGILRVWKKRGETLAVLLERIRKEYAISPETKITYAGRLDPMAEGEMILLVGEARFSKEAFLKLPKTYRFEVLLGVATDTYDALGLITDSLFSFPEINNEDIEAACSFLRSTILPYPPFSSKPVDGTPLFVHARTGGTPIDAPLQTATPTIFRYRGKREVALSSLVDEIIMDVRLVQGDFRQEEIIRGWETIRHTFPHQTVQLFSFEATVPSGVYIRSIAHAFGERIGVPSLAFSITRTRFG